MELGRINGVTFAPFPRKGMLAEKSAYESLDALVERTNANFIMLTPFGLQKTAQSEEITWDKTVSDEELTDMVNYIHSKGLMVAIKPTVNCENGTWRAHICFFDKDVVCEPKWSNWFASYSKFQCHYAAIAEKTGCEMFVAGCEMVQSEHRADEWRGVIADIRKVYSGIVSYNTDKYQEDNVTWWDAVDVISSSGYYPIDDWNRQLDRIEPVVRKFNKPFFFAECGCMSSVGSSQIPNNWELRNTPAPDEQAAWYEAMFSAIAARDFVSGTCLWSWTDKLYSEEEALSENAYDIYLKPAEAVVKKWHDYFA